MNTTRYVGTYNKRYWSYYCVHNAVLLGKANSVLPCMLLTYGDSATVALKVTQPLPGGGAVHSTCTSLFSTAESACVTACERDVDVTYGLQRISDR